MTLGKLLYEPTPEELADACAVLRRALDAVDDFWDRYNNKLTSGSILGVKRARGGLVRLLTLDDTFDQATGE